MDFLQPHSSARKHPQRSNKKRLNHEQVRLLETSFNFNNKLDSTRKSQLADELGVPARQIAIWYQNKRARWKNQTIEEQHKALQLRLEAALEDKGRLEREVERLKAELDKVRKSSSLLVSSNTCTGVHVTNNNNNNFTSLPSFSSSCDEVGSSSLLAGDDQSKYDQLDGDFYACFGDAVGHFDKAGGHDFFSRSMS